MSHFRKYLGNRIWIDINKKQLGLNFSPRSHHFPQCQFQQQRDEIMLSHNHSVAIQDFPVTRPFHESSEPWAFITDPNSLHQLRTTDLHKIIPSVKTQCNATAWNNPLEPDTLWCNPTSTAHRKVNSIICLFVYGFFDKTDTSLAFTLVQNIWMLNYVHVAIASNKSRREHCYKSVLLFSDI